MQGRQLLQLTVTVLTGLVLGAVFFLRPVTAAPVSFPVLSAAASALAETRKNSEIAGDGDGEDSSNAAEDDDDAGAAAVEGTVQGIAAASPSALLEALYDGLSKENLSEKLANFYDAEATLDDPFGHFTGRAAILAHWQALTSAATALNITVNEEFVSGEETVALWQLSIAHAGLEGGKEFSFDGASHVRFAGGHIVAQRDYYDVGELIYARVPIIGALVRWVKQRVLAD